MVRLRSHGESPGGYRALEAEPRRTRSRQKAITTKEANRLEPSTEPSTTSRVTKSRSRKKRGPPKGRKAKPIAEATSSAEDTSQASQAEQIEDTTTDQEDRHTSQEPAVDTELSSASDADLVNTQTTLGETHISSSLSHRKTSLPLDQSGVVPGHDNAASKSPPCHAFPTSTPGGHDASSQHSSRQATPQSTSSKKVSSRDSSPQVTPQNTAGDNNQPSICPSRQVTSRTARDNGHTPTKEVTFPASVHQYPQPTSVEATANPLQLVPQHTPTRYAPNVPNTFLTSLNKPPHTASPQGKSTNLVGEQSEISSIVVTPEPLSAGRQGAIPALVEGESDISSLLFTPPPLSAPRNVVISTTGLRLGSTVPDQKSNLDSQSSSNTPQKTTSDFASKLRAAALHATPPDVNPQAISPIQQSAPSNLGASLPPSLTPSNNKTPPDLEPRPLSSTRKEPSRAGSVSKSVEKQRPRTIEEVTPSRHVSCNEPGALKPFGTVSASTEKAGLSGLSKFDILIKELVEAHPGSEPIPSEDKLGLLGMFHELDLLKELSSRHSNCSWCPDHPKVNRFIPTCKDCAADCFRFLNAPRTPEKAPPQSLFFTASVERGLTDKTDRDSSSKRLRPDAEDPDDVQSPLKKRRIVSSSGSIRARPSLRPSHEALSEEETAARCKKISGSSTVHMARQQVRATMRQKDQERIVRARRRPHHTVPRKLAPVAELDSPPHLETRQPTTDFARTSSPAPPQTPPRSLIGSLFNNVASSVSKVSGLLHVPWSGPATEPVPHVRPESESLTKELPPPTAPTIAVEPKRRVVIEKSKVDQLLDEGDEWLRRRKLIPSREAEAQAQKEKEESARQESLRSKSYVPDDKPKDYWKQINRDRYRQQKEHEAVQRAQHGTFGLFYDDDPDDYDEEADRNPTACLTLDETVQKFFLEQYGRQDIPDRGFMVMMQKHLEKQRKNINLSTGQSWSWAPETGNGPKSLANNLDRKIKEFEHYRALAQEVMAARKRGNVPQWQVRSSEKRKHEDWVEFAHSTEAAPELDPPSKRRRVAAIQGAGSSITEKNRGPYTGQHFADNIFYGNASDNSDSQRTKPARAIDPPTSPLPPAAENVLIPTTSSAVNVNAEALAREREKAEKYKSKTPTNLRSVSRISSSPLSPSQRDANKENAPPRTIADAALTTNEFVDHPWPTCPTYIESGICDEKIQKLMDERWTEEHQESGYRHFVRDFERFKAADAKAKALGVDLEVVID